MQFARSIAGLTAAAVLAAAVPTFADSDAQVTIVLKSGAKYRGDLVEEVPNDHVTIKLATGEVKRFAWDEIVRDAPAPAPPPVAPVAPVPPPPPAGPMVHITRATPDVAVERMVGHSEGWVYGGAYAGPHSAKHYTLMCNAPCDRVLPSGDGYRVTGRSIGTTKPFVLSGTGTTNIDIDPGDKTARSIALGFAAGFLVVGSGVALYAGFGLDSEDKKTRTILGGVAVSVLVLSVVGFVVAAKNGQSVLVDGKKVSQRSGSFRLTAEGVTF
jgi:hypothetical protein